MPAGKQTAGKQMAGDRLDRERMCVCLEGQDAVLFTFNYNFGIRLNGSSRVGTRTSTLLVSVKVGTAPQLTRELSD